MLGSFIPKRWRKKEITMTDDAPEPLEVMELLDEFRTRVVRGDYLSFIGNDDIVFYSFADDFMGLRYVGYLSLLFPANKVDHHTISLSRRDGNVYPNHVRTKKVLVLSGEFNEGYAKFIGRRFSELEQEKAIARNRVRYVTAKPYKIRKLDEFYSNRKGEPENHTAVPTIV